MSASTSGWRLAFVSVLGLVSSLGLRIFLDRVYTETPRLDALKSLFFWGDPGGPAVHAPPFFNPSQANTLLAWAALTAIIAVVGLVRAGMARERGSQGQPRAIAIIVSLLTLYCLWHSWPLLAHQALR